MLHCIRSIIVVKKDTARVSMRCRVRYGCVFFQLFLWFFSLSLSSPTTWNYINGKMSVAFSTTGYTATPHSWSHASEYTLPRSPPSDTISRRRSIILFARLFLIVTSQTARGNATIKYAFSTHSPRGSSVAYYDKKNTAQTKHINFSCDIQYRWFEREMIDFIKLKKRSGKKILSRRRRETWSEKDREKDVYIYSSSKGRGMSFSELRGRAPRAVG